MPGNWYKNNPDDKIWWLDNSETKGEWLFSFDKKHTFNMFADYPHNLTPEQKKIFDEENPEWCEFFKDRVQKARSNSRAFSLSSNSTKRLYKRYMNP